MWDLWAICHTFFKPKDKPKVYSIEWAAFIGARLDNHPAFEVPGEASRAIRIILEVLNTPPDQRDRLMD